MMFGGMCWLLCKMYKKSLYDDDEQPKFTKANEWPSTAETYLN